MQEFKDELRTYGRGYLRRLVKWAPFWAPAICLLIIVVILLRAFNFDIKSPGSLISGVRRFLRSVVQGIINGLGLNEPMQMTPEGLRQLSSPTANINLLPQPETFMTGYTPELNLNNPDIFIPGSTQSPQATGKVSGDWYYFPENQPVPVNILESRTTYKQSKDAPAQTAYIIWSARNKIKDKDACIRWANSCNPKVDRTHGRDLVQEANRERAIAEIVEEWETHVASGEWGPERTFPGDSFNWRKLVEDSIDDSFVIEKEVLNGQ